MKRFLLYVGKYNPRLEVLLIIKKKLSFGKKCLLTEVTTMKEFISFFAHISIPLLWLVFYKNNIYKILNSFDKMHDKCTFCALYNTGVCLLKKVTKIINKMHYKLYIDNSIKMNWVGVLPPLPYKKKLFFFYESSLTDATFLHLFVYI